MSKPVKAQTPPVSKSGGGKSSYTKFVHLRTALAEIEAGITVATAKTTVQRPLNNNERAGLEREREALVSGFEVSRYLRGKLLWEYREGYRGSKGPWMKALQALANTEGVHINTIRNYIKDYEAALNLPESVRSALSDKGVDAAKKKNRTLIERIMNRLESFAEPREPNTEQASQIVADEMMKIPVAPDLSDVSERLDADEKLRHLIRKGIRQGVNNIHKSQRLEVVKAALEEEMYMNWGQKEPVTITLTPHSTPITFDGRKLKSDGRTQEVAA
jgi:hypothetical protein